MESMAHFTVWPVHARACVGVCVKCECKCAHTHESFNICKILEFYIYHYGNELAVSVMGEHTLLYLNSLNAYTQNQSGQWFSVILFYSLKLWLYLRAVKNKNMTLSQVCCVGWCISLYFNGEPQTRKHIPRRQAQTLNVWVFTCFFIVLNVANKIQLQIEMQIKKFTSMAGVANNMKVLDMREMWMHRIAASQHRSVNFKSYCLWWKTNWLKNWSKIKAKCKILRAQSFFFFFQMYFSSTSIHICLKVIVLYVIYYMDMWYAVIILQFTG